MQLTGRLAGLAFAAAMLCWPARAPALQSCAGDGDRDSTVTIAELVQVVGHALDGCPEPSTACNGDVDGDGFVTVAEVVSAVQNALSRCEEDSSVVVDVGWLEQHLDDPRVQPVDARVGASEGGHIPGAIPLSPYTLATTVDGVPFQVVGPGEGEAVLAAIGLERDATVVVYGVPPEFDPTRVVWALRFLGHQDVRYLDGGWNAWIEAEARIESGPPEVADPSDYSVDAVRDDIRVTGDWVLEQLGEPPYEAAAIQLVDARSAGEYSAGRIPTAVNVAWTLNLEDGLLRSRQELIAFYTELGLDPSRTTVTYCTAGWRASVAWLTLTWLGFEDVRVYDGSWLEWGAGGRFPIEVGDD